MKIYDGKDIILGRLAATAAKAALLGEEVKIVNCERVVISGRKENTFARERQRRLRKGYPLKSAKYSKLPDRIVRRAVRGMLPWKFTRGKEAYKRVMCYIGIPEDLKSQEFIILKDASKDKLPTLKYTIVGNIGRSLGGKSFLEDDKQ